MSRQQAEQFFVMAQQFAATGRVADARAAYRRALSHDDRFVPALFALGQMLAVDGVPRDAYPLLARALDRTRDDRQRALVLPALADVLAQLTFSSDDSAAVERLVECLESPMVDAQALAPTVAAILRQGPDPLSPGDIADSRLWGAFLTNVINTEPDIERKLIALRRLLLDRALRDGRLDRTAEQAAVLLAIQAELNEYVWLSGSAEEAAAATEASPIVSAMYRPLSNFLSAANARSLGKDRLTRRLVQRSFDGLTGESAPIPSMPSRGNDAVGAEVRHQYEQNPYPRWSRLPATRRRSLHDRLADVRGPANIPPTDRLKVLVAGCGTGYELATLVQSDPDHDYLAIDLSAASIDYARRMLGGMAGAKVEFMRGNILDLPLLGRSFDVIISSGVIHHMADPVAAAAALASVMKPDGLIRLGLYSRRARAPLNAVRAAIASGGYDSSLDGIRRFRAHLLADGDLTIPDAMLRSPDFNCVSGCRDLLFHVCENEFSLPGVGRLLVNAGLTLITIEPDAGAARQFQEHFGPIADPSNLELWDQLEADDPTIFAGMIFVWARLTG